MISMHNVDERLSRLEDLEEIRQLFIDYGHRWKFLRREGHIDLPSKMPEAS